MEGAVEHVVRRGELLIRIGKAYKVNYLMIQRLNGIADPTKLRENQRLKIITGRTSMVAYKSEFRMALLIDGAFIKEYPIGIGLDDRTPVGKFVIDSMGIQVPWTPPEGGMIRYGEPGYLLGERWMGFRNEPWGSGLGIHGTNDEESIGTKCSRGCIRMRNRDVVELYDFVQIGSKVEILE
jgi:hypothetical protein